MACRPGAADFAVKAAAAAQRQCSETATSGEASLGFEGGEAAFDFRGWRRCLPLGSDTPHAHDHHHRDFDQGRFDHRCLLEHHMSFFGAAYVPRQPGEFAAECERAEGHMDAFGRQGQPQLRMDEVSGCLASPTFLAKYVRLQRPVVMRGCARAHPAATRWARDEWLASIAGDWTDDNFGRLDAWLAAYNTTNLYGARVLEDMREARPRAPSLVRDLMVPPPLIDAAYRLAANHQLVFWSKSPEALEEPARAITSRAIG